VTACVNLWINANWELVIIVNGGYENIELLEELRKQFKTQNPKGVERRNAMLIFDLVVKYCQYSETLGAMINAFELSNKDKNPTSTIVLTYLKKYQVRSKSQIFLSRFLPQT
jgi:hypothetical protein